MRQRKHRDRIYPKAKRDTRAHESHIGLTIHPVDIWSVLEDVLAEQRVGGKPKLDGKRSWRNSRPSFLKHPTSPRIMSAHTDVLLLQLHCDSALLRETLSSSPSSSSPQIRAAALGTIKIPFLLIKQILHLTQRNRILIISELS